MAFPPKLDPAGLVVHVRDSGRVLRGTLPVRKLTAVLRHSSLNAGVGTWVLEMDAKHEKASRLLPSGGIYVTDLDGDYLFSGPLTKPVTQAPDQGADRTLMASGVTDEAWLSWRLVYPDPTQPANLQTAAAYYTAAGNGETLMRNLVNVQAGPGALLARRVAGLALETNLNRGSTVEINARFSVVGAELSALGQAAGLSWRVVQVGTSLVFQVYVPQDLTARAKFSRDIGNLGGWTHGVGAPEATFVAVAGQGEGTARTIIERSNATAEAEWGMRVERFLDRRDSSDTQVLEQAGFELLAEQGPSAQLEIRPLDLPRMRYSRDYGLGDKVTVEVDTVAVTDVVRQVTLAYDVKGLRVTPLVGDEASRDSTEPKYVQRVQQLSRRVSGLETRR